MVYNSSVPSLRILSIRLHADPIVNVFGVTNTVSYCSSHPVVRAVFFYLKKRNIKKSKSKQYHKTKVLTVINTTNSGNENVVFSGTFLTPRILLSRCIR